MGQKHLTLGDRVKIETLIREHYNLSDIANQLGYSRATITKEIQRATNHATMGMKVSTRISRRMYNALEAQTLADQRQRHKKLAPSKLTKRRQELVKDYIINKKWSPEQIANGPLRAGVCFKTIYNWVNRRKIKGLDYYALRTRGKRQRYHKRALSWSERKSLYLKKEDKKRTTHQYLIDFRPMVINNRNRFGHWEIDGVESRQSSHLLLTFVERFSRYAVSMVIKDKSAYTVSKAIEQFCQKYKGCVDSVTCDRGSEFIALQTRQILNKNKVKYYFAHAYSPYERGSNENFNKLLREYYPKKTDFAKVSQSELNESVMGINKRPMRIHRYMSRLQAFKRHCQYRNVNLATILS
ncbi:IS30 family transposase [Fructobacillus fructosus]|uniref:IS30 family transposase n=1 Tax=Fructobacillus fructosus TaxID=1631 RepID=UPI002DAF2322|nr:IS30 family (Tra8) [Fructobacillus fructosus]CAK1251306.1 IS30 family (Tra8) [Fructobacillus fructosus]CAK1251860.1 IS30 family (Tra8) [Fructobacillus fructosus]